MAKWDFKNLYFAKEEQRVDVAAFNQVDLFSDLKINNFFPREKEVKKRRETKLNWKKMNFHLTQFEVLDFYSEFDNEGNGNLAKKLR